MLYHYGIKTVRDIDCPGIFKTQCIVIHGENPQMNNI